MNRGNREVSDPHNYLISLRVGEARKVIFSPVMELRVIIYIYIWLSHQRIRNRTEAPDRIRMSPMIGIWCDAVALRSAGPLHSRDPQRPLVPDCSSLNILLWQLLRCIVAMLP